MKSYIKLYGPPLIEAVKALRKVAIGLPEVCVMDSTIAASLGISNVAASIQTITDPDASGTIDMIMSYFGGPSEISKERCGTIISKSGESVGKYDFYFEWFKNPTMTQVEYLITRIDEALMPLGVRYTITTK